MVCYYPLKGYRSKEKNKNGKYEIVFGGREGYNDLKVDVPCGQCWGCRIDRTNAWAVRCMHEASLHSDNCFITLTYNSENLPVDGSLKLKDFQKFMKRVRKKYPNKDIKYFHCGEYGEKSGRPHYHAIIFGHDFRDQYNFSGRLDSISVELGDLWPFGLNFVGDVTFDSARYVASYIFDKFNGEKALSHYKEIGVDKSTGEVLFISPEYATMSRRPGIGKGWFDKFGKEVYNADSVIVKGREQKPPKYYDRLLEKSNLDKFNDIKLMRRCNRKDFEPDELFAIEKTVKSRMSMKKDIL